MNKLVFLIWALFQFGTNGISQEWVATSYKDEFGDPSGKRSIEQKTEGTLYGTKFKLSISISRDVPSSNDFKISAFDENGKMCEYIKSKVVMKQGYSKDKYVKNPTLDPVAAGDGKVVTGKYLFKYKIGDKESSFRILKPNTGSRINSNTIYVNYKELDAILLSVTTPVKCMIADDSGGGNVSNLIMFTIYPANYKKIIQK